MPVEKFSPSTSQRGGENDSADDELTPVKTVSSKGINRITDLSTPPNTGGQ